jgi:hypothetical protein
MKFQEAIDLLVREKEWSAVRLLDELRLSKRSQRRPRGPVTSQPMTIELLREIRDMALFGHNTHQIAAKLGINQGRVSEALRS